MANTFSCPSCKHKVSKKAESCPNCGHMLTQEEIKAGLKLEKNASIFGWIFVASIIVFGAYACTDSEEDIAAKEAEKIKDEQKKIEDKRKGFHCLSGWDGSHIKLERLVKNNLRDPDSYEHIETKVTPVDKDNQHFAFMKYRAKNGYGGMTIGNIKAVYDHNSCEPIILSSN